MGDSVKCLREVKDCDVSLDAIVMVSTEVMKCCDKLSFARETRPESMVQISENQCCSTLSDFSDSCR